MRLGPLLLLACCGHPSQDVQPASLDAVQTWSALAPMVAVVRFSVPAGAESWVEFGLDGDLDRRTPSSVAPPSDSGTAVAFPLLGLKAGRQYAWRAVSDGPSGRRTSPSGGRLRPVVPEIRHQERSS